MQSHPQRGRSVPSAPSCSPSGLDARMSFFPIRQPKRFGIASVTIFLLLGALVAIALPGAATASATNVSPSLSVTGGKLSWSPQSGVTDFKGAISTAATGGTTSYQDLGNVTSWTPVSQPGQTLYYSVASEGTGGERWSSRVAITWRATPPVLSVSSGKISWPAQAGVSDFKGAISTAPVGSTSRTTTYQDLGNATTWSPTPAPGETLYYGVASEGTSGEQWGSEVAITWPGTPPPSPTGKVKVGVMNIGSYAYNGVGPIFAHAGITYTREDVGGGAYTGVNIGTCNSNGDVVCDALKNGIVPIVLFEGYGDSNVTTEIVNLAKRLDSLASTYPIMNKMHVIEFGNEMWQGTSGPTESGSTYGAQYDAAHRALAAAGEGSWKLLAAATAICGDHDSSPNWINQVIGAQSGGASEIDGWTVHPYGPMTTDAAGGCSGPYGYGWPDVNDWHTIAANAGSNAPWYVTEVGMCLGGSGCNDPVPEGSCSDLPEGAGSSPWYTQAADMRQYLTDAGGDVRTGAKAKYPWIAAIIWYQTYDDSTGWFGVLGNGVDYGDPTNTQRPAFCELQQWIAANGEG